MIVAAAILIFIVSLMPQNVASASKMMEKAKILNLIVEAFIVFAFIYERRYRK